MNSVVKWVLLGSLLSLTMFIVFVVVTFGPAFWPQIRGPRYDTVPPTLPASLNDKAILIFFKTNFYRHDCIPAANTALKDIAARNGWSSYATDNGAVFNPEQLRRFKVVVWNSVSGDVLTTQQRKAFKTWVEQGGGFIGLHNAGGDPSYAWRWYVDDLIGAQFIGHTAGPHIQQATIIIEDPTHPATRSLGPTWVRRDEWYSFASSPRRKGYHILARLDESSYRPWMRVPFLKPVDLHMGADHPMIWWHCVGNGRAFYSALGHEASAYSEPKYLQVITGAISWAEGLEGPKCINGVEMADNSASGASQVRR